MKTLPEKWCINPKNIYQDHILVQWRGGGHVNNYKTSWLLSSRFWVSPHNIQDYTEITFEQFRKYVLKEDIYENNEGSVFEIDDEVTINNPKSHLYGQKLIITNIVTNKKGNLVARFNDHNRNGIRLDNLQHYIEDLNNVNEKKLMFLDKEYKILSFKCEPSEGLLGCNIVKLDENGINYSWDLPCCKNCSRSEAKHFLSNDKWEIHSVKRLADNQVFTIGDKTTKGIIHSFKLQKNHEFSLIVRCSNSDCCLLFKYQINQQKGTFSLQKEKKDKLVYYMDNGSIFPRFESIALQKPDVLHFETIEDCKEFYSKKRRKNRKLKIKPTSRKKRLRKINSNQNKTSNKIWSFKNNTGTGAFYTYNVDTDTYDSNISDAKIPYSECLNRYPIYRVINTQGQQIVQYNIIKQSGPRFRKKYKIIGFKAIPNTKTILAFCKSLTGKNKNVFFEIDKITHINN
jgi:hypothetical protein